MRTPLRFLAVVGLLFGLVGATTVGTGAQAASQFDFTVIECVTTDDSLVGQTEFLTVFSAGVLDCVEELAAEGVTVTIYDAGDDSVIDSDTTDSGGAAQFNVNVTDSLDFYLGEDFLGNFSDPDTIEEGEDAEVTIILFTDADGELEVTKTDEETSNPIEGAGFTLYDDSCQTPLSGEVLTDANGVALFEDILAGDYCLVETTVPEGYFPLDPISTSVAGGETTELPLTNEAEPLPGAVAATKYVCEDDDLAGTVEFDFVPEIDVSECDLGVDYEITLEDVEGFAVDTIATDENGEALFDELDAGTYSLVETATQSESEQFAVEAGETVEVNVINYVEVPVGQVLISAFTCTGDEADVEIEVSDPTTPEEVSAQGGDDDCVPIEGLQVFIFLFGDEGSDPIEGTTDEDGTILFADIPVTDEETGPHLFRTIVFDSDFEADFDVEADAITAITVLVFEPPAPTETPEPTNTAEPTSTTQATAAPTGTVSSLPGTGAGAPTGPDGSAAWLLAVVLGLAGLGTVGYALRRRAA